MARNHMHFAKGYPGDKEIISGMRSTCDVLVEADLDKSIKDGIKWYISANGVILSPGDKDGFLLVKYFKKAIVKG